MSGRRGASVVLVVGIVLCTSCVNEKDHARNDAIDDIQARLAEITYTAQRLVRKESPEEASRQLRYLYGPEVYQRTVGRELAWKVVLSADASYSNLVSRKQNSIGGCVRITTPKDSSLVETSPIQCSKVALRKAYPVIQEEIDILSTGT